MDGSGPTPEELAALAARMVEEMKAQGVVGNVGYDRDNQRLVSEAIDPVSVVGLARTLHKAAEDEKADMIRRYVAAHVRGRPTLETWEEARAKLLPKVRPELERAVWPLRSRLEGWTLPTLPSGEVTEHLRVQFVWEIEDGTATVHAKDVERWGVSLDELQDAAAENLLARTPAPCQWLGSDESPGVYRSKWRDGFDATRILLRGNFGIPAKGPLVAIATGDSTLFLADSADEAALFQLGLAAQREVRRSHDMVWLWPLLLEGETRAHWLPPESSAGFAPLSGCAALHAQTVYNQHGALLQRVLELEGSPVDVGVVGIAQNPLGASATVVVWKDGAPAALAHADAVQFRRREEVLGIAPWQRVLDVMGDHLEEVPGYPKRYRAATFPEPWQLGEMDL